MSNNDGRREACRDAESPCKVGKKKDRRMFSVDLKSRDSIWSASLENNRKNQGMLIEGSLGALQRANFHENGLVLEIIGTEGVLRVDLRLNDLATEKHDNCMMKSDEDH